MVRIPAGRLLLSLLILSAIAGAARAGTTGKLAGRVTDEHGAALAGVNVRIEGERLGAVSDDQGRYFVLGITAGPKTVRANLLGYRPFNAERVSIAPDFTTTLDITLHAEAVQLAEVKVEAERPLLQRDATGTTRFVEAKELQNMPIRGYREAVALQSGVVNFQRQTQGANQSTLIVRGGRPDEVAYFVDGFAQQDPLNGLSGTTINNDAIQEIVVLTGGFNPEYGRVMSGAVNVITKEGSGHYSGSAEALTDNLGGSWVGTHPTDYNLYDMSLGGPVMPGNDRLTFYVSGERRWERDRLPTYISPVIRQELGSGETFGPFAARALSSDYKPGNSLSGYTGQAKLTWHASDATTLRVGGLTSYDDWREYTHFIFFNPSDMPRHVDRSGNYNAVLQHSMNPRTFWSVGANWFEVLNKRGDPKAFDNLSDYAHSWYPNASGLDLDFPLFSIPTSVGGDYGGGVTGYEQHHSTTLGLQGSLTSQFTVHQQLKVGGDAQFHSLRYANIADATGFGNPDVTDNTYFNFDGYGYRVDIQGDSTSNRVVRLLDENSGQDRAKHPRNVALYAQDKFEREGVVMNGGLRWDWLSVDAPAFRDPVFLLGNPSDPTNIPDSLESGDLAPARTYSRISPRFGLSFPVDEKTILRFNYGQFFQAPTLRDLYVNYRYLQWMVRTRPYFINFGNPNLRPERTTAYEVGIARQFATNVRLDLTAYYKDVKDLVEVTATNIYPFGFARNRDFATIKGMDVGFTVRPTHHTSLNLSYSLSYASGTGSSSTSDFRVVWLGGNAPKVTAPLDFDQRHKLAASVDWRLGASEGPKWLGRFRPLQNTGVNVLLNVASGTPYTPYQVYDEVALIVATQHPAGSLNSHYGPWTSSVDVKANRQFNLGGRSVEAYALVLNALDEHNAISVYRSSGAPNTTGWLDTADGQAYLQNAATLGVDGATLYRLAENNPLNYANPRLVRFGLRTSF